MPKDVLQIAYNGHQDHGPRTETGSARWIGGKAPAIICESCRREPATVRVDFDSYPSGSYAISGLPNPAETSATSILVCVSCLV